jgi:hypothetical protein
MMSITSSPVKFLFRAASQAAALDSAGVLYRGTQRFLCKSTAFSHYHKAKRISASKVNEVLRKEFSDIKKGRAAKAARPFYPAFTNLFSISDFWRLRHHEERGYLPP